MPSPPPPDARCPVCDATGLVDFLTRSRVPVHQNLLCDSLDSALVLAAGQLTMAVCPQCGFATNRTFDERLLRYGEQYDNSQMHSPAFDAHVNGRVDHLIDQCGVRDCTVIEVGCGKGHFLQRLVEREGAGNRGYGFDPSYIGPGSACDGRLRFRRTFYDESCADLTADVVVCRHVIEHLARPRQLLANVRAALERSPHARLFFETPCLKWILSHQVAWDFFYEHCSLFTAQALATAFRRAGFVPTGVEHVFEGQYLWMEVAMPGRHALPDHLGPPAAEDAEIGARDVVALARAYGESEYARNKAWIADIRSLASQGGVALWGAGAKGVTFANLVDPQRKWIRCLIDMNPHKQGRYLPGTGHPIVPPTAIQALDVAVVVLLNPNYRSEVAATLAQLKLQTRLVDLMRDKAVAA